MNFEFVQTHPHVSNPLSHYKSNESEERFINCFLVEHFAAR